MSSNGANSITSTFNGATLRLLKGDITDIEVEAFVYYARTDLDLKSGFGGAIAVRGGPSIKHELENLGSVQPLDAVLTGAGDLKARFIIHAVGPKFQEEGLEFKLREVIVKVLQLADAKSIRQIAFPPMGAGFYGVPLATCSEIMIQTVKEYLNQYIGIREIIVCLQDNRELKAFQDQLTKLK